MLAAEEPKRVPTGDAMKNATSKVAPDYPAIAKQLKLAGTVEVDAYIREDGSVAKTAVVGGNPVLAHAATEALMHWTFSPFKDDGKAVPVVSTVSFVFKGVQ
jgi:protein TonB